MMEPISLTIIKLLNLVVKIVLLNFPQMKNPTKQELDYLYSKLYDCYEFGMKYDDYVKDYLSKVLDHITELKSRKY